MNKAGEIPNTQFQFVIFFILLVITRIEKKIGYHFYYLYNIVL